jgi:hypothetical protein
VSTITPPRRPGQGTTSRFGEPLRRRGPAAKGARELVKTNFARTLNDPTVALP